MSKEREVYRIVESTHLTMGATKIKQPLPASGLRRIGPFLLLHHFGPDEARPGQDPLNVGAHPHRGFEPVTFLYSGGIQHKDSLGNTGVLGPGDVQWMTAGSGVIHSEKASPEFLENGGVMEGIQLWVNLPKSKKMLEPDYQDIRAKKIPAIEEEGVQIRVVAGSYQGQNGPARTQTPILALQVDLEKEKGKQFSIPPDHEVMIYVLNGVIELQGKQVPAEHLIQFKMGGEEINLMSKEKSQLLLLSGAPIEEPLAQYGPFVMNSQQEIIEAVQDYQAGKMGTLKE